MNVEQLIEQQMSLKMMDSQKARQPGQEGYFDAIQAQVEAAKEVEDIMQKEFVSKR